jgi:hypothetical protein
VEVLYIWLVRHRESRTGKGPDHGRQDGCGMRDGIQVDEITPQSRTGKGPDHGRRDACEMRDRIRIDEFQVDESVGRHGRYSIRRFFVGGRGGRGAQSEGGGKQVGLWIGIQRSGACGGHDGGRFEIRPKKKKTLNHWQAFNLEALPGGSARRAVSLR